MTAEAGRLRRGLGLLVCLGALTHFVGLTYPRQVVFDEVTMGKYLRGYCCTGERVFDMHPPHAKLLYAVVARAGGFDGAFTFDSIGTPYGDTPVFALRLGPALAGILIPPLFLLLLLEWGASWPAALLGGLMLVFDNALLVETKIIVWDGPLVAATLAALVCFFSAQRRSGGGGWRLLAAGAFAGLAVGSKITGLSALAVMLVCLASGMGGVGGSLSQRARRGAVLVVVTGAVYVAGWVAHWMLLTQPGPADAFYTTTGRMIDDLIATHRAVWRENVNLKATHPDASSAWSWPLMLVAPYFWQGQGASMYLVGNPIVWWGAALLVSTVLIQALVLRPLGLPLPPPVNVRPQVWLALTAYGVAYVPLFSVTRVLFLYHYLTPLVFSLAAALLWLDRGGWTRPGGLREQRTSFLVVLALTIAGFLAISPLTYGFSAGQYDEWLAAAVRSMR